MLPRFSGVDCPSVDPRQSLCSPLSCPAATAFCCLPLCSPATNCLSLVQLPTLILGSSHQLHSRVEPPTLLSPVQLPTASLGLLPPTASLWRASSTLIRLPVPLPGTARFQVQESFVWFRAKTDSSALAAYPHSATYVVTNPRKSSETVLTMDCLNSLIQLTKNQVDS